MMEANPVVEPTRQWVRQCLKLARVYLRYFVEFFICRGKVNSVSECGELRKGPHIRAIADWEMRYW